MREIKFRAWQKYHKTMNEVLSIEFDNGKIKSITVFTGENTSFKSTFYSKNKGERDFYLYDEEGIVLELMQYTGLKDKTNKEIFEGDVIKLDDIICAITWEDGGFHMKTNDKQGSSPAVQFRVKNFKVIGNIFENPELLK